MKVDYIIVGCGLASIAFCEELISNKKSFVVFDDQSQQSSVVAAGLYNPVILKRFSEVWKAKEQLKTALPFYHQLEVKLQAKLDHKFAIYRRFASIEEQNLWFEAADNPKLDPYLSTKIVNNTNASVNAPYGFGEVLQAGRIDTNTLITSYKTYLSNEGKLIASRFQHDNLLFEAEGVQYDNIEASGIVFAEGFGLKKNPFFKDLPLNGTKGEVVTIKASNLKLDKALKSGVFIIPIGNDLYKVGATYNWDDKTNLPTEEGKSELIEKLKTFILCDFEVVDQKAGIRPTVKDRRPLVGRHYEHKNLYVLNGLGTRGVMIAPYIAPQLYNYIEHNASLEAEIDIKRFTS
ncbi:FAD-dependent oxidoreductase [Winogradskyella sp. 3972H.M.0a.05]|uniref:NAD(P)/FAD-dependent oxidoreductase n=1 Tax=Winogradskyella sp. 3972H.M.0a.05 TaxID=2950277 RepID=UPI0033937E75